MKKRCAGFFEPCCSPRCSSDIDTKRSHREHAEEIRKRTQPPPHTAVYAHGHLNLSLSPELAGRLALKRARQKRCRCSHVYSLREFGLSESDVAGQLANIVERFGSRPEDVPQDESRELP